jgi:hypothetical protein
MSSKSLLSNVLTSDGSTQTVKKKKKKNQITNPSTRKGKTPTVLTKTKRSQKQLNVRGNVKGNVEANNKRRPRKATAKVILSQKPDSPTLPTANSRRAVSNQDSANPQSDTLVEAKINNEVSKIAKQAPSIIRSAMLANNRGAVQNLLKPEGLEVKLMEDRGRYLPKQAVKLLDLFYQQYAPQDLKWVHKGKTKTGLYYLLGKVQCNTNGSTKPSTATKTAEVALYLVYKIKNSRVQIQNLELDR